MNRSHRSYGTLAMPSDAMRIAEVGMIMLEKPSPHVNAKMAVCLVSPSTSANGAMSGIVIHTALVSLGLSALIVASPQAFLALKIGGAGRSQFGEFLLLSHGDSPPQRGAEDREHLECGERGGLHSGTGDEGGTSRDEQFTLSQYETVRYGARDKWIYKTLAPGDWRCRPH